jgi:hypothetical protein
MKKIQHYLRSLILCGFTLSAVVACNDLEEEPISFVQPENFYTSPEQIEAAFAGSMNRLWNYWAAYSYGMGNFRHDDQLFGGDLNISSSNGTGLWNTHYAALLNINHPIKAIKNGNLTGVSQEKLDELMAQAKFLRSYNYFMLVRMFGPVPLLTEDTPDPIQVKIRRSPIADVYNLIISDLTEAAINLPAFWPEGYQGRPTSGVAKGMLAKVYLTMATAPLNDASYYQKAADIALEVMKEGKYSLVDNVEDVFSLDNKYGPEMMWSFNSNYEDIATDPQIWAPGILGGWGDFSVDPIWEQNYPDQPRKIAYLITDVDGVHYTEWAGSAFIKKYLNISQEDFNAYRSIINLPIIRYADVLLIFAEAENMAKGGPTQAAVDAINQIIDRANGYIDNPLYPRLSISMSMMAFDEAVIEERNLELCFEYDRWFDLIRKRILKEKRPEWEANFSENDYLFPIPENDLRLNSLLDQNPGYPDPPRSE